MIVNIKYYEKLLIYRIKWNINYEIVREYDLNHTITIDLHLLFIDFLQRRNV